jgi:hypothetical protein
MAITRAKTILGRLIADRGAQDRGFEAIGSDSLVQVWRPERATCILYAHPIARRDTLEPPNEAVMSLRLLITHSFCSQPTKRVDSQSLTLAMNPVKMATYAALGTPQIMISLSSGEQTAQRVKAHL